MTPLNHSELGTLLFEWRKEGWCDYSSVLASGAGASAGTSAGTSAARTGVRGWQTQARVSVQTLHSHQRHISSALIICRFTKQRPLLAPGQAGSRQISLNRVAPVQGPRRPKNQGSRKLSCICWPGGIPAGLGADLAPSLVDPGVSGIP